jgi:hypothetical protein
MKREELYARFEELDKRASQGGGPDKIEKQHASGRMTARERSPMCISIKYPFPFIYVILPFAGRTRANG